MVPVTAEPTAAIPALSHPLLPPHHLKANSFSEAVCREGTQSGWCSWAACGHLEAREGRDLLHSSPLAHGGASLGWHRAWNDTGDMLRAASSLHPCSTVLAFPPAPVNINELS